jgi:threonine/homoserine/homoserine lactone efflux protein
MSVAFLLTSLVIVATPGTGALFTIAAGLSRGARASLIAAAGCTLGIVPHPAAAITPQRCCAPAGWRLRR